MSQQLKPKLLMLLLKKILVSGLSITAFVIGAFRANAIGAVQFQLFIVTNVVLFLFQS